MKKLTYLLIFVLCGQVLLLHAQTNTEQVAIPLSKPGQPGLLKLETIHGNLKVSAYEGNEVVLRIKGEEGRSRKKEEEKEGLRRISSGGLGLEAIEENNVVSVVAGVMDKPSEIDILVPRRFSLKLQTVNGKQVEVNGVRGEIEISNVNGDIILKNVQGSANLNTVNGNIQVSFDQVNPDSPMAFTNLNGDVEVSLPADTRFSVKAKTEHGEVYTDFDIKVRPSKERVQSSTSKGLYRVNIENWTQGDVNGGGPEFLFKSLNGDILIRKK